MTTAEPVQVERTGTIAIDAVMQVMGEAFDPAFGEAWTAPQVTGLLGLPGTWLMTASDAGTPAGFALARATLDEGELLLIGVRPLFRRRGTGAALVEAVVAEARTRGVRRLHLEVRDGNGARALYTRMGFAEIGRRRDYYHGAGGNRMDAVTLSRTL
ncbi:ribosomal-protein-alanine N-acetyltransferase [Sphingomonas jejuensis]|uniref:Ribosomal-protein-alanine N-acetyltransferase n=1 Tax=Sphingomonas jejuensis TaxID=904715 RepID=A0ABX0XPG0_9SPHN|nr:GNAT family N-acetyltransferase [Sphingomonas jejuensis]NJC35268.1 ribosomal-protein-alanine N-acetyltransferase [Sphingomonas jejuensis]